MTNVSQTESKTTIRNQLQRAAVEALEQNGWTVERMPGTGKSSLRRIKKGTDARIVSIRTTQDQWIAFPRINERDEFGTLPKVDFVVASSVDDRHHPKTALVHLLDGDEMRERFARAVKARKAAGYALQVGRGIWISLYQEEATSPVTRVGAGAGRQTPPIARIPLQNVGHQDLSSVDEVDRDDETARLTIPEAKALLAESFGVDPSNVKITIEA
ncbi:hypothetical protein CKO28_10410 [Rhodovibrio sodomensis]|uniref:Uncharacterized protein n=1 Tax=Rhodovibrio sodomensis TaxID=1088 RepID=A0ABS1DDB8_9PROT|nr:hypothetical protein [Rhodovibrio sodomensis]MBK1668446.1 hypothetical protein [Rhodovibrio sodomensis]